MSWRSVLLVKKTNKTDRHDITEILFWVPLISINQQHLNQPYFLKGTDLSQVTDEFYLIISSTPRHERGSNSQIKWWLALIAQVVVIPWLVQSMVVTDNELYRQWFYRQWVVYTMVVSDCNFYHVKLPHLHVYLLGGKPRNLIEQNTVWLKNKWNNEEMNVNCWSKNWKPFRSTCVLPRFLVRFA
jgi:hypothetical protein